MPSASGYCLRGTDPKRLLSRACRNFSAKRETSCIPCTQDWAIPLNMHDPSSMPAIFTEMSAKLYRPVFPVIFDPVYLVLKIKILIHDAKNVLHRQYREHFDACIFQLLRSALFLCALRVPEPFLPVNGENKPHDFVFAECPEFFHRICLCAAGSYDIVHHQYLRARREMARANYGIIHRFVAVSLAFFPVVKIALVQPVKLVKPFAREACDAYPGIGRPEYEIKVLYLALVKKLLDAVGIGLLQSLQRFAVRHAAQVYHVRRAPAAFEYEEVFFVLGHAHGPFLKQQLQEIPFVHVRTSLLCLRTPLRSLKRSLHHRSPSLLWRMKARLCFQTPWQDPRPASLFPESRISFPGTSRLFPSSSRALFQEPRKSPLPSMLPPNISFPGRPAKAREDEGNKRDVPGKEIL